MKIKALSILALGALVFTACSDDDVKYNSAAGVTVSMEKTSVRISEDQASATSFAYIPVVVSGETNGALEVTVELAPYGEHPATADVNYIMTSQTIIIPAGQTTGRFQYYPKGDDIINDDRSFEVKIVDVKGASIGTDNTTVVTLVDNEGLIPIYYTGLLGSWDVAATGADGVYPAATTIIGAAEGQDGYGKEVTLVNFPETGMTTKGKFSVDGVEQEILITIDYGQQVGVFNHPTYGAGQMIIYPTQGDSYWSTGTAYLKFNFDLVSGGLVPDPEGKTFSVLVSFAAGMMMYEQYTDITFSR